MLIVWKLEQNLLIALTTLRNHSGLLRYHIISLKLLHNLSLKLIKNNNNNNNNNNNYYILIDYFKIII